VLLMNHQESLYVANVRSLYDLRTFSSTIWYIKKGDYPVLVVDNDSLSYGTL
jgi:hypothetical protein